MANYFKKRDKKSEAEINQKRTILINPFVKKYNQPVIVHASNDLNSFLDILKSGKIKLPKTHKGPKKCLYMERFLGIDNSIFFSLGFVYLATYEFKYNLIFDLDLLRETVYYRKPISFKCYKSIIDYWYDNDKPYLNKLKNYNSECKKVVEKYLHEKETQPKWVGFEFWKIEKEVFYFIQKYPKKNVLFKIAKDMEKGLKMKWPYSKRSAMKNYLNYKFPEIISLKEIDLLKSPYFLGFFIDGKMSKQMEKVIREKYKGKILYDGKKMEVM